MKTWLLISNLIDRLNEQVGRIVMWGVLLPLLYAL